MPVNEAIDTNPADRPYPQRDGALPHMLDAVTPDWLSALLQLRYPEARVNDYTVVELRNGHTTKMRVKLDMNEAGHAAGIPEHVCLKANWSGSFGNVDIHALEARFYHYVADAMQMPVPKVYYADWDGGESGQGVVMMEDLALAGGAFGNSLDHLGVDGVATALETIAAFHAKSWGDPRLNGYDWLPHSMGTPIDADQLTIMWPYVERNIYKPEYQAILPQWLREDPTQFHTMFGKLARYELAHKDPLCIVHGDSHQGNSYLRGDGARIWMDWQLVRKGRPWRDVAYFLIGSLTIEERRANEMALLAQYRDCLLASGAQGVPSLDGAFEVYRRWPIYGCQAWVANVDEWGQSGLPITERFFTALDDLETVRMLNQ